MGTKESKKILFYIYQILFKLKYTAFKLKKKSERNKLK